MKTINIIAALSANSVIGSRLTNDLPWPKDAFPEDMDHFRKMTAGENSVVLMGSATMRSLGMKKGLPKRRNIVISRQPDLFNRAETGIETYGSIDEALSNCSEREVIWCIGGGKIFEAMIYKAKKLFLTIIPQMITSTYPNDLVYFPFLNPEDFEVKEKIALNLSKQLFCYVYERDTWLEKPLNKNEQKIMEELHHDPGTNQDLNHPSVVEF